MTDPGALEVGHFVAQRERDLADRVAHRLVVADERPAQHRHRPVSMPFTASVTLCA